MSLGLAFLWGLSEATFLFVVPDVIISFIALKYGFRTGLYAVGASIFGALIGGLIVYLWGKADIDSARAFYDLLPAIAPSTIARAGHEVSSPAFGLAMLKGSMTGVPFKLYASEAGAAGTSLIALAMLTPLVRFPRFFIAVIGASLARRYVPAVFMAHKLKIMAGFWIVFYALYWSMAPH